MVAVSVDAAIASGDFITIGAVDNVHTNPGAPTTSAQGTESAIWSISPSNEITATWVNPDGTPIPLFLFIISAGGGLYTTYAATDLATVSAGGGTLVKYAFT